ncbi:MAG: lytic transglycosylase domain-containing protein [Longimicrobiales bacterium]
MIAVFVTLPVPLGMTPVGAVTAIHESAALDGIARRLDRLEGQARDLESLGLQVAPLARTLMEKHSAPQGLASQIARALVREARQTKIAPQLLLAVLLVENPWLDPQASSFVGAVGLMQVMHFHAGAWGCPGADLTDPDVSICHGARILAHALVRSGGDLDRALLRYNGCVHGTNTPDCHRYPEWVRSRMAGLAD